MSQRPETFFQLDDELADYDRARAAILRVPLERTTSWGKGTAFGPDAILRASWYVETWDDELRCEPCTMGIATLPSFLPDADDLGESLAGVEAESRRHLEAGKLLVVLGGEHSITQAPVRAAHAVHGEIGVVQFDAHADLREAYHGTPLSHAAVMRRVAEMGLPTCHVGIRAISPEEAGYIDQHDLPVLWGRELDDDDVEDRFAAMLDRLPDTVYLTFDVDYFDPSLLPATGTPEPGGGFWNPTMRLLRLLFEAKTVVAMDVVELAPGPGQHASDFVVAKLVYKLLGYSRL